MNENLKDLEAKYKALGDEIEKLKKQEEVVYKIGDIFYIEDEYGGGLHVLAQVLASQFSLIGLESGNRFRNPIAVTQNFNIARNGFVLTDEVISNLCSGRAFRKVNVNFVQV